jgi:uncharacterized membrane protein YqhA
MAQPCQRQRAQDQARDGDHRHFVDPSVADLIEAGGLASGKTGYTETGVMWQTIIHTVFILSAIGIAYVDRLSNIATAEAKHAVSH